jgi:hypothetical protein
MPIPLFVMGVDAPSLAFVLGFERGFVVCEVSDWTWIIVSKAW